MFNIPQPSTIREWMCISIQCVFHLPVLAYWACLHQWAYAHSLLIVCLTRTASWIILLSHCYELQWIT